MSSEVFDKLDAIFLFLPKLDVSVDASGRYEISAIFFSQIKNVYNTQSLNEFN